MNKYKFLKISPSKKIRYLINKYKKKPYVVFLHGFMSDLEGQKPRKILKFCNSKKIGFLAIEYSLGFLGIGSAPEFLENLIWKKFNNKMKNEIKKIGIYNLKHGNYEYPITYQLIKDGRKNKILNKKIKNKIYVTMIHGKKDEVVPVSYSKKVLKVFKNANKKLLIIKNGDHSLSSKRNLDKITKELNNIISNYI